MNGSLRYRKGKWVGQGREYEAGVLVYDGAWNNCKHHGEGTSYFKNGKKSYSGQWDMGNRHGKGTSYFENGKVEYEGEFMANERQGRGVLYDDKGVSDRCLDRRADQIFRGGWIWESQPCSF